MDRNKFFDFIKSKVEDEVKKGLEGMDNYEDIGKKFAEIIKEKKKQWNESQQKSQQEEKASQRNGAKASGVDIKVEVKPKAAETKAEKEALKKDIKISKPKGEASSSKSDKKTYAELKKKLTAEYEMMKARHRISQEELAKAQKKIEKDFKKKMKKKLDKY